MADTTTKSFLQRRDELTSEYVHTVHYISRLSSSQEVIVDTRAERGSEPVALVAGRGECSSPKRDVCHSPASREI